MSDSNKEVKKGASKRFRDKLKVFKLPKVSRARGRDLLRRNSKNRVNKPAERVKAPKLTKLLEQILDQRADNKYVLWLGLDFARALKASVSSGKKESEVLSKSFKTDALKAVAELIKDDKVKTEVNALLAETKADKKADAMNEARGLMIKDLGSQLFYSAFSKELTESVDAFYDPAVVDETPFRLVKSLQPGLIVYTGTDRLLEKQFLHDNVEVLSYTPVELLAFGSAKAAIKHLQSLSASKVVVLKLMGDITKAETVALSRSKLEEEDAEGEFSRDLVRTLAEQMPFVFVGEIFEEKDSLSVVLKQDKEVEIRHSALASGLKKGHARFPSNEVGVEYVDYTPDEGYTQVIEFLASMASHAAREIPAELGAADVVHKAFSFENSAVDYVKGVANLEVKASTISIYTNDLTSLSFVADEKFAEEIMFPGVAAKCGSEETAREVMEAMTFREEALKKKLFSDETNVSKPIVRLLVPTKAAEVPPMEACVSKTETLIRMLEDSQGKIELRFTEAEVAFAKDFEILFVNSDRGVGDVVLLSDTETSHFSVNWFDQNTNEAEEKELLFERMWNVASTHTESLELLKSSTAKVKAQPMKKVTADDSKNKSKSKFGFFSRSKSPSKTEGKTSRSPSKAESEAKKSPKEEEKTKAKSTAAAAPAVVEKVAEKPAEKVEEKPTEKVEEKPAEEAKPESAENEKPAEEVEKKDDAKAEAARIKEEKAKAKQEAKEKKAAENKAKKDAKAAAKAKAKADKAAKKAAKDQPKADAAAEEGKDDAEEAEKPAAEAEKSEEKVVEEKVATSEEPKAAAAEGEEKKDEGEEVKSKAEETKSKADEGKGKKKGKKAGGIMNKIKGMTLNRSKKKKLQEMVPPVEGEEDEANMEEGENKEGETAAPAEEKAEAKPKEEKKADSKAKDEKKPTA